MQPTSRESTARNVLITAGAYYLSIWVAGTVSFVFGKATQGLTYRGSFNTAVIAPLVIHLPVAAVAALVGALVINLVESSRRIPWAIVPAVLYALFGFLGYHWARPPLILDRVEQTIGALFPAFTCLIGALLAENRMRTIRRISTSD
jgi:hypothetical protein